MNEDGPSSSSFSDQAQSESPSPKSNELQQSESPIDKKYLMYRSQMLTESGVKANTNEAHMKRLESLRNELNYLKETEWMFESIDRNPPTL